MSQYHTLLFYTTHPNDVFSREILGELEANPDLKKQVRPICVSNRNLTLPKMIIDMDTFPVIVTRGIPQPIKGEHALSWLKEHNSGKANGFDYGDPDKANQVSDDFGTLVPEASNTAYHQAANDEWNRDGVDQTTHMINSTFSSLDEVQNVDTYEEAGKKGKSSMDRDIRKLQMERDRDIPQPIRRIDGPMGGQPLRNLPAPPMQRQQNDIMNPRPPPFGFSPHQQQYPQQPPNRNFPPMPPNNPMVPQHPGSMNPPPGNSFPPQVSGGQGQSQNVPVVPSGFGSGNVASLDNAYNGMSLLEHTSVNNQFNTRRERSLPSGLPTGRGSVGPHMSGIGTRGPGF